MVESNLKTRRIRLVFVTDSMPRELRRLVEFLNEEMENVRVLAVEMKQYQTQVGEKHRAIAPRVVGLTEATRRQAPSRTTTQDEFLSKCHPAAARFFERALEQVSAQGFIVYWGKVGLSFRVQLPEQVTTFAYCWAPNRFQFYFHGPIRSSESADPLRQRLLATGLFAEHGDYTLEAAINDDNLGAAEKAFDMILAEIAQIASTMDAGAG